MVNERTAPVRLKGGRPSLRSWARGLTLIELAVVVGIIAMLASIAVQNILRARSTSNEAAAIGNLHGLMQSLQVYQAQQNGFPLDWQADMFTNVNPPYASSAFNMPMTDSLVQGYLYTYEYISGPDNCPTGCSTYTLKANPQTEGWQGTRAFYADQTGRLRHCTGSGPATASNPLITDKPDPCG